MTNINSLKTTAAIIAMTIGIIAPSESNADTACAICPFESGGMPYLYNNLSQNQIDPNDPYCNEPGIDCSLPDSHHEIMLRQFLDDSSWSPGDIAFIGASNTYLIDKGLPAGTLPEKVHNFGIAAENIDGSNDVIHRLFLEGPAIKQRPSKIFVHTDVISIIQFFESGCTMESDPDSRGIQAAESAMCQYDILIGTLLRVQAEYPEVDIVLQPVLPLGDPTDTYPVVIPFIGDVIDATDILNEYIRIQADTWGFTFVDLHDDFLDYSDTPSPPDLSNPATSTHRMDPAFRHEFGLHLNQDGYRRWMGKISPYFAEDIQSGSIYSPDDSPPGNYTTLPPTALGLQLWSSEDQRYYWGNLTVPPSSSVEIRGDSSGNNMLAVVNADTLEIESFSHVVLPYYTQAIKGNDVAITYQNNSMSQKDVKVVFGLDEDGFSDFTLEIETSVRAKKGTNFGFLFENMVQQGNRDIGFHTSEGDSHIWFDIEIPAGKSVYGYYFNATHPAVVRSTSLYSDMRQANSTTRLYGRPTSTDFYYKNNSSENITVYLLLELNTETPNPSNGFLRIY